MKKCKINTAYLDVRNYLGHNKCSYLNSLLFWKPQPASEHNLKNSNRLNVEINGYNETIVPFFYRHFYWINGISKFLDLTLNHSPVNHFVSPAHGYLLCLAYVPHLCGFYVAVIWGQRLIFYHLGFKWFENNQQAEQEKKFFPPDMRMQSQLELGTQFHHWKWKTVIQVTVL